MVSDSEHERRTHGRTRESTSSPYHPPICLRGQRKTDLPRSLLLDVLGAVAGRGPGASLAHLALLTLLGQYKMARAISAWRTPPPAASLTTPSAAWRAAALGHPDHQ